MTLDKSDGSIELSAELARRIREHIEETKVTTEHLAERLGLLPLGAELLLQRTDWSIDLMVRIAEAVGLRVSLELEATSG